MNLSIKIRQKLEFTKFCIFFQKSCPGLMTFQVQPFCIERLRIHWLQKSAKLSTLKFYKKLCLKKLDLFGLKPSPDSSPFNYYQDNTIASAGAYQRQTDRGHIANCTKNSQELAYKICQKLVQKMLHFVKLKPAPDHEHQ